MQLNIVYLVLIVTFQNVIEAQNYLPQEQQPPFAQFAPQSILTNYQTSSTTEKPIMTTTTTTTTTTTPAPTTTTPVPTTTTTTPYTTTSTSTQPTTTAQPTTTTSTTTTTIPSTTSATYIVPSAIYPTNSPSLQNTYFAPETAPSSGGFGLPPAVDISQSTINPYYQPMHQSPLNFFQSAQRKTLDFLTGGGGGSDANGFNLGDFGGALTSILTPMAGAAAAALTAGGGASLISLPNASIQPTLQKTFVVNMGGNNPPLIVQGNAYQPGASAGGLAGGGGGPPQARSGSGLDNFNIKGSLSQLAQTLGYPRYPNYPPPVYRQ